MSSNQIASQEWRTSSIHAPCHTTSQPSSQPPRCAVIRPIRHVVFSVVSHFVFVCQAPLVAVLGWNEMGCAGAGLRVKVVERGRYTVYCGSQIFHGGCSVLLRDVTCYSIFLSWVKETKTDLMWDMIQLKRKTGTRGSDGARLLPNKKARLRNFVEGSQDIT